MNTPVASSSSAPVQCSLTTPRVVSASKKKLSGSPYASFYYVDDGSDRGSSSESELEMEIFEGQGCTLFELEGLMSVFHKLRCGECGEKGVVYREDFTKHHGCFMRVATARSRSLSLRLVIAEYRHSTGKLYLPTSVLGEVLLASECSSVCSICLWLYQRMCTRH